MIKEFSDEKLYSLYKEYGTPAHVIRHCKGVTNCSLAIGQALNEHGYNLDLKLIYAAGMTHDVARTMDDHGKVIADRLEREGYQDIADIVRVHMRYNGFTDLSKINETDIVCLGDRLVKEDKYVGLDERVEYIIDKAGRSEEVCKRLYESKKITRAFMDKIEIITGNTIDEIVNKYSGENNDR